MKKKILSIPFIQFICCAMIVILHSNNINSFSFNISEGIGNHIVGNIENIFTIAGHSALPIFFFITGYFTNKKRDLNGFIKNKLCAK